MFQLKPTRRDVGIAIFVLSIACLLLLLPFRSTNGTYVEIVTSEKTVSYALDQDQTVTVNGNGHTLVITIANRTVCITESDCPDGICKAKGTISKVGETILCAPAGILLTVKGDRENVDFVIG